MNVLIIYAHPNARRSELNHLLLDQAQQLNHVRIHDLYAHYPDFDIHVPTEQALLKEADVVIFQHPLHWYSCPALLQEWFEQVLEPGYAYGPTGKQLKNKKWLSIISTAGRQKDYQENAKHGFTMDELIKPFVQISRFCSMEFLPPFITHHSHRLTEAEQSTQIKNYRAVLQNLLMAAPNAHAEKDQAINNSASIHSITTDIKGHPHA